MVKVKPMKYFVEKSLYSTSRGVHSLKLMCNYLLYKCTYFVSKVYLTLTFYVLKWKTITTIIVKKLKHNKYSTKSHFLTEFYRV